MAELNTFGAMEKIAESINPAPESQLAAAEPIVSHEAQPAAAPEQEPNNSSFELSLGDDLPAEEQHPSQPQFNWKDEIKKLPLDEVAAELGFDPFALEINKHIKGGGRPVDYLEAKAIDYNKFSDDALVKDDLRKQYPTLTPQQIDLMYDHKYLPNSELKDDIDFAATQLQADAYKIRQAKIAEQQKFKIAETPIPQKDEAYELWQQNREQHAQNIEALKNYFTSHPATKALNESKRVTLNLGEGVTPFNFVVDKPELINRVLTDDGSAWSKLTSTPQGEPDIAKQQLLTLVAYNPVKAFQDVFNYGVQMGERKRVAEGQNAQRQQAIVTKLDSNEKGTYRTATYGSK